MQQSNNFLINSLLEQKTIDRGITRQIMGYDDNLMVAKVSFDSGADSGSHAHGDHSQSSYVASGVFEVTIDGECRTLRAGDGYFAARGVEHDARCIEQGVLIDTFSPLRLDCL